MGIAVTKNTNLVYTDHKDKSIVLARNSESETLITLRDWKPCGVCSSPSGDLLVTMQNCKETKVLRYSGFEEKQFIHWDDEGQPLFSSASYICENRNLDICVADHIARAVIVTSAAGSFRFRYSGHSSSIDRAFTPRGITTDSQKRIITADSYNELIHITDTEGNFLIYIDNCDLKCPLDLCVDSKDNIIVAEFKTGLMKKIQCYQ